MAIVIGCVIGSGVFVKPGLVLMHAGSSDLAILAWVLGGIITLAGGLTVAEVAFRMPKTGGIYIFVENLYGKDLGFVAGWVQSVIYGPGLIAALALYFGSLFVQFFKIDTSWQMPISLFTMYLLTATSILGTKYSSWIQNSTTLIKMIPIVMIGIFGLIYGQEPVFGVTLPESATGAGMGAAILATLWAYDGWMGVSNIAGEIENPSKNLPKAIIIGLSTVMTAYILVNLSLFHVLDKGQIVQLNENSAAAAAAILFGPIAGKLLGLGVLLSIFGCLNGQLMVQTRVPYAMANYDVFPFRKKFATLHPKTQTPLFSILFMVGISSVMIIGFKPDRITDLAMFSMYLFYGMVFIGIFKVRKQFGVPLKGNYKIPLFPLVPIIATLGCMVICYGLYKQQPWDVVLSLSIASMGFPIFRILKAQLKKVSLKN